MAGQIDVTSYTLTLRRGEVQPAKGYADESGGITPSWERDCYVGSGPRLRPGGIGVDTGQTRDVTGRVDARAIKGRTGLVNSQNTLVTARDTPQPIRDVRIDPELPLQLDGQCRYVEIPVGHSNDPMIAHTAHHLAEEDMAVPNVQGGRRMADNQTLDPQVTTSLNQNSEWEIDREVAMRILDVRSTVGIHENACDTIRHPSIYYSIYLGCELARTLILLIAIH